MSFNQGHLELKPIVLKAISTISSMFLIFGCSKSDSAKTGQTHINTPEAVVTTSVPSPAVIAREEARQKAIERINRGAK